MDEVQKNTCIIVMDFPQRKWYDKPISSLMVDLHVSTILYRVIIYMDHNLFLNLAVSYFLDHLKEGVSMQHKKQNWKIQGIAIQKISKKFLRLSQTYLIQLKIQLSSKTSSQIHNGSIFITLTQRFRRSVILVEKYPRIPRKR